MQPGGKGLWSLFLYAVDGGDGRGVCGVSDSYPVALRRVVDALLAMSPGVWGSVRLARVDVTLLPYPSYRYGPVVCRVRRDGRTGRAVVVRHDGPSPVSVPGGGLWW